MFRSKWDGFIPLGVHPSTRSRVNTPPIPDTLLQQLMGVSIKKRNLCEYEKKFTDIDYLELGW